MDPLVDSVKCWLRSIRFQTLDYDDFAPVLAVNSDPSNGDMFCCGLFRSKVSVSGNSRNASALFRPAKVEHPQQLCDFTPFQRPEEFERIWNWRPFRSCHSVVDSAFQLDGGRKYPSCPQLWMLFELAEVVEEPQIHFGCATVHETLPSDDIVLIRIEIPPQYLHIRKEQVSYPAIFTQRVEASVHYEITSKMIETVLLNISSGTRRWTAKAGFTSTRRTATNRCGRFRKSLRRHQHSTTR